MSQLRNKFLRMRVSAEEETKILEKIETEFSGDSFSNCNRILWGLNPLERAGAPKGNKNKLGKKGANKSTKTKQTKKK
jgi:hypothetical protein